MNGTERSILELTERWNERFPTFAPKEVLSPDGYILFSRGVIPISLSFMDSLQAFRTFHWQAPLIVNTPSRRLCGWRSCKEFLQTKKLDQVFSFHCVGAADLHGNSDDLFQAAMDFGEFTGVGRYSWGIHVDCRPLLKGQPSVIVWDG